jgi:hypothetical protein
MEENEDVRYTKKVPSESLCNHTFGDLGAKHGQSVEWLTPFFDFLYHAQKTAKFKHHYLIKNFEE